MFFWIIISLLVLLGIFTVRTIYLSFGKKPVGEHLKRIENSPNYHSGVFHNRHPTVLMTTKQPMWLALYKFLFRKAPQLRPSYRIPSVKNDLYAIDLQQNISVWLGHSSLYFQVSQKRILVDPVFSIASPIPGVNRSFKGANKYHFSDFPFIDYILITHDHYDHLDYQTMRYFKNRIKKVIVPLGVGSHLRYWGFVDQQISELDWGEQIELEKEIIIFSLPSRHFSGRGLKRNNTLWSSYMIQGKFGNIYLSSDSGFDTHFEEIKQQFGNIRFVALENGQYNTEWSAIHMLPEEVVKAAKILSPDILLSIHHSKFALSTHPWNEPLEKIFQANKKENLNLITPIIGQVVYIDKPLIDPVRWWRENKKTN